MRLLLADEGFTAHTSLRAEAALITLEAFNPDLIISDAVMPGINGIELCRMIKSDPKTADIPVLLVSGLCYDDSSVAKGLDAGAAIDVMKREPERVENLRQIVKQYLDGLKALGYALALFLRESKKLK